jgi:hypothetical protein
VFEKHVPGISFDCIKTVASLPASPRALFNFLTNSSFEERRKWEPEIIHSSVLKSEEFRTVQRRWNHPLTLAGVSSSLTVVQRTYKAPFPVYPREFIALNSIRSSVRSALALTSTENLQTVH